MLLCLNDSNCFNHGRCVSGMCLCPHNYRINQYAEVRSTSLIPPLVGALRQETLSSRHVYLAVILILAAIGFINNLLAFIVFLRPLIRLTVSGIYSVVFCITGFLVMLLLLTNIPTAWYYDRPGFRSWACHTYPYLHLILINLGLLMTAAIATEGVLTKCFGFRRFRSRKCAIFTVLILLAVVAICNLDKIFARRLHSNGIGHLYCTYRYNQGIRWIYMHTIMSYVYIALTCGVHALCLIVILWKMIRQKRRWYRKITYYQDILVPSTFILFCLLPYLTHRYLLDSCRFSSTKYMSVLNSAFTLLLYMPQLLAFVLYVVPNGCSLREFRRASIRRSVCACVDRPGNQHSEFEVTQYLWKRKRSSETIATISSLNDEFFNSEFYNKIRLEV
jgi:hypothetical protein